MILIQLEGILRTLENEMSVLVKTWSSDMNKHTPLSWKQDKIWLECSSKFSNHTHEDIPRKHVAWRKSVLRENQEPGQIFLVSRFTKVLECILHYIQDLPHPLMHSFHTSPASGYIMGLQMLVMITKFVSHHHSEQEEK